MLNLTPRQHEVLLRPLRASRVQKRSQGGQELSYLAAYDVKAHLIRLFGYGGFDAELIDYGYVTSRPYETKDGKAMVEVLYRAKMRLVVRDLEGNEATFSEGAVGSASGPEYMLGEHHDNALKTAASDALKRCAINLGDQFGLGLYDRGSTAALVKQVLVAPEGAETEKPKPSEEQVEMLKNSLGATEVTEQTEGEKAAMAAREERMQVQEEWERA